MASSWLKRWGLLALLAVASAFLLGGCDIGGSDDPGPTPKPVTSGLVTVSGQVANSVAEEIKVAATGRSSAMRALSLSSGAGIDGVLIVASMNGWELARTTTVDGNGFYGFDVPVPAEGGRLILTFSKSGRITYQKAINVKAGEVYPVHAVLLEVTSKPVSKDQIVSTDLISIEAPGTGEMTLFVGDPTSADGAAVFPGDYMAARADSEDVPLVSMAFFEATLTSGDTKVENFDPIEVALLLPQDYQNGTLMNPDTNSRYVSGDFIEWWSYDKDDAKWVQEDAVSPDQPADPLRKAWITSGDVSKGQDPVKLYVNAMVNHFSWWNADYPQEFAYFCVQVVDGDGKPLVDVPVFSQGVTYKNTSQPVRTDENGWASGIVVKKSTADPKDKRERAQVYALAGNVKFMYDVISADEGSVVSDDIYTPYDEKQCERTDGRPSIKLTNVIKVSFEGEIKGKVSNEAGKALADIKVFSSVGGMVQTDSTGSYSFKVPVGAPVTVYIAGVEGKTVTVKDKATPETVNFNVPNQAPVITKLARDPEGQVNVLGSVKLFGEAVDPEGGVLTYSWKATEGTLSVATGSETIWTAPNSLSGTAQVTFTATDLEGKSTSMTVPLSWGTLPLAGRLVVNLVDKDGKPVPGALVVLHRADDVKSVERTITTNALGKADFGDIKRATATISYGLEGKVGEVNRRVIRTVEAVPVAELKILVDILGDDETPGTEATSEDRLQTIGLSVNSADLGTSSSAQIKPFTDVWLYQYSPSKDDVAVLREHLQSDGKMTLLSIVQEWDETTSESGLAKWGVRYDVTPVSGEMYNMPLDRTPINLGWSSNVDLTGLSLSAARKGVEYTLAEMWSHHGTGFSAEEIRAQQKAAMEKKAKSGILKVADLEADLFYQSASGSNVNPALSTDITGVEEEKRLGSSRPSSLTAKLPDYLFSKVSLDVVSSDSTPTKRTASWRLETTDDIDIFIVGINGYRYTTGETSMIRWEAAMEKEKGDRTYTFPQLPKELEVWLEGVNPTLSLSVADFDNVTGYRSLMDLVLKGQNPEKTALREINGNWPFYSW